MALGVARREPWSRETAGKETRWNSVGSRWRWGLSVHWSGGQLKEAFRNSAQHNGWRWEKEGSVMLKWASVQDLLQSLGVSVECSGRLRRHPVAGRRQVTDHKRWHFQTTKAAALGTSCFVRQPSGRGWRTCQRHWSKESRRGRVGGWTRWPPKDPSSPQVSFLLPHKGISSHLLARESLERQTGTLIELWQKFLSKGQSALSPNCVGLPGIRSFF